MTTMAGLSVVVRRTNMASISARRTFLRVAPATGSTLRAAHHQHQPRMPPPLGHYTRRGMSTSARVEPTDTSDRIQTLVRAAATTIALITIGTITYAYVTDTRASVYPLIIMPVIQAVMDPEDAHRMSIWLAARGVAPRERGSDDALLRTSLWGKEISNPIGLAAGYDKHAEAVDAMFGFGFGMVEVGSITPKPQPGNPKPRMFRLPQDKAVINRYGFNSEGHEAAAHRLLDRVRKYVYTNVPVETSDDGDDITMPNPIQWLEKTDMATKPNRSLYTDRLLGINLGKNKSSPSDSDTDYTDGIKTLGPYADYIVINISSPNTPGLRSLQRREPIRRLLANAVDARDNSLPHRPPILVKIAPDLSDEQVQDIASVVMEVGVDGVIVSNTTVTRPKSMQSDAKLRREVGGLSGPPVLPLALETVSRFYKHTSGRVPIIGCGGIRTADDVIRFARAGASAVQVYTAIGYDGPGVVSAIKFGVGERLRQMGGVTWGDLVGSDHRQQA